jgi:hypothetical protein
MGKMLTIKMVMLRIIAVLISVFRAKVPTAPLRELSEREKQNVNFMKLGEKQELFMRLVPRLIDYIHSQGYEIRGGDLFRDDRVFGILGVKKGYGHKNSAHKLKLAIDLNLFLEGRWLTETEDHRVFGEWWEKQHPLCRWGGRFNDGNHYSLEHEGMM